MSYASILKKPAPPKVDRYVKLLDVLSKMPYVELVKYRHIKPIKSNVIPVKYEGNTFEFIKDNEDHWNVWYNSFVHERIFVITPDNIVNHFNSLMRAWNQNYSPDMSSSEEVKNEI